MIAEGKDTHTDRFIAILRSHVRGKVKIFLYEKFCRCQQTVKIVMMYMTVYCNKHTKTHYMTPSRTP